MAENNSVVSDVRIFWRNPNGDEKLKAFASCIIFDEFCIGGLKVIQGNENLFVSMPQDLGKDKKYHDICFPTNSILRKDIEDCVIEAYMNGNNEEKPNGRGRSK